MASISQVMDLVAAASSFKPTPAGLGSGRATPGVLSPWQTGELASVPWQDVFGQLAQRPTRLEAMKIPGVTKARAILHALVAPRPLIALNDAGPLEDQPAWLYRSDRGVAPELRTRLMLDDLFFNEATLLVVARGSVGQILDAQVVPYDWWSIDDGVVTINDEPMRPDDVIWIPGPGPGLLAMAADTIAAARDMTRAWAARVHTPTPSMILQEVEDNGMTVAEAQTYVDAAAAARRSENGATMFIPHSIAATPVPANDDSALFEGGRNALRLDVANFTNFPASLLDGTTTISSLTYSTQEGRRNEVFDYSIPYWTNPIESALSLDNVVPRGQRVRFNFADLENTTATPTGAPTED